MQDKGKFIGDLQLLNPNGLLEFRKIIGEIAPKEVEDMEDQSFQIYLDKINYENFQKLREQLNILLTKFTQSKK